MPVSSQKRLLDDGPRIEPGTLCWRAVILSVVLSMSMTLHSQEVRDQSSVEAIGNHYELAQKAQESGDVIRANSEYKMFISEAFRRLSVRYAAGGDLRRSLDLLQQALALAPNDSALRLDYIRERRVSGDYSEAKAAAESLLVLEPDNSDAHLELGRILSSMGSDKEATLHLEKAVVLNANFENGFALAKNYLKRKDPDHAARIFAEMLAGLGNTAEIHLEFGRAFAEAGFPDRGIPEFEKAISLSGKVRGGHYSLGAAYLLGLGNAMDEKAAAEFERELAIYPDDPLSLYQLASIEYRRHNLPIAERDLARAQGLDPCNPDIYLLLGQIYSDSGRAEDAQAALRKSIAFTIDVRRNNFQVQRAHYLLGRLLMQSGQTDEARKEMKAAEELLRQSTAATQGVEPGAGTAASTSKIQGSVAFAADALQQARILEARISGAVADSYNNLGAMAATNGDFPTALLEFRQAAQWNPLLEGLDYNWARAAFSAGEYEEAIGPLTRQLVKNPDDRWTHSALGSSYFSLKQYAEAVRTLRQVESSPGASPQLDYIYAVSQIRSGEMDAGVERLEALERANPEIAPIAEALAEAYAARGQSEKAGLAKRRAESLRARSASSKQKSN